MRLRWTLEALKDFEEIVGYVAQEDSQAARAIAVAIKAASKSLETLPNRGRPGFIEGTRELIIPRLPHFFVYRVHADQVQLLRILHQAQKWPRIVQ
ncbi:type II toxin-antitoxin system RelE/ParE family toxin [Desulfovibrio sp. UIB00]|uniref:type II toxin-antitoxin system RelE/ParE family toxin n=1 Tax=Desulfovibrio sp. UIB00 TaxID=2804314 RepID=UPI001F116ECF|nr:type II toxin-antitoxin system RelE/ParE family toxin [Desulfovibrio sp. UIB00]MCH5146360.1 type II toxin-antitoxin system RelE/ParE family toxin [Desulfovibrio sp. UIB00]